MEDYKEKLRLAKEALNSGSYDKETIEYIFPELKESENEVMKGKLREILRLCHVVGSSSISTYNYEKLLAWLAKQGEQPNKVSIWKHWNNGIAGNGEGKLIYLVKRDNIYRLSSCLSFECDYIELSELDKLYVEKQGEQNPAWSEEDEKTLSTVIEKGDLKPSEIQWLESLKERMKGE